MLSAFFRRLTRKSAQSPATHAVRDTYAELNAAERLLAAGQPREALPLFERLVEFQPDNAYAHNGLGICYSDIGDASNAVRHFDIAFALDDMEPAILANRVKMLIDSHQYADALQCLNQLAALNPDFNHLYAVYSGFCIALGEAEKAKRAALKAWISNFGNLRLANCYLFNGAYACTSEIRLAQEHRFWAQTLHSVSSLPETEDPKSPLQYVGGEPNRRIKLAYWSPDFRNHSVRYFFKPLLKGHDRSKFEIHLLHDIFTYDEHTDFFKNHCDFFHDVFDLTDQELRGFLRDNQFDILVELAGHSSANRLNLMNERWAPVQITALGYPPTTGLQTVDYKLADRFTQTSEAHLYGLSLIHI